MSAGGAPAGAVRYAAEDVGGCRAVFTAWRPPPPPGDALCRALTGMDEETLVYKILGDIQRAGRLERTA